MKSLLVYARGRTILRKLLANGLYYSGLLWLYAAFKLHRRVVVLMYHRVLPDGADTFSEEGIIVTPATFARHLRFLKRFFHPVSVDELSDSLHSGRRLPSRGCLITFDDGWHDNVVHALPLLIQHDMPAVVFLATDYVGSASCFWQERLTRRMYHATQADGPARALVEAQTTDNLSLLKPAERRRAIRAAVTGMKQWAAADVLQFESQLDQALTGADNKMQRHGDDHFMAWNDAARLVPPSPLVAAAHGCSHVPLTSLPPAQAERELREARERVQAALGRQVTAIAYPNGNYDDTVIRLAGHAGYRIGFTTQRGLVSEGDDPLRLRRLNIHEASTRSMPEFLCIILGVFHKWPRQV